MAADYFKQQSRTNWNDRYNEWNNPKPQKKQSAKVERSEPKRYSKKMRNNRSYRTNTNKNRSHNIKADTTYLYFILGIVGLFVLWPLLKMLRGIFYKIGSNTRKDVETLKLEEQQRKDVLTAVENSINLSNVRHNDAYFINLANNAFDEMDGPNLFGTSKKIFDDVRDLNGDELKKVFMAFNYRSSSKFLFMGEYGNIIQWYKADLSPWSLFGTGVNDMKEIWAKSGLAW